MVAMEPNLRQTYLSELAERIEDFSAIWPHFAKECELFDKPNVSSKDANINRWRVRKYAAEILLTSAQIGRILDPHPMRGSDPFKQSCVERGKALRTELSIPSDSPLLDNDLRNALEHVDEHIDRWVAENPHRSLTTWAYATTAPGEVHLEDAIRRIHVRSHDVFVLDHRANLDSIHGAVLDLARHLPVVQRTESIFRIDDPKTGKSDVITQRRVLGANEKIGLPPPQEK
jgi:hypothetical protein